MATNASCLKEAITQLKGKPLSINTRDATALAGAIAEVCIPNSRDSKQLLWTVDEKQLKFSIDYNLNGDKIIECEYTARPEVRCPYDDDLVAIVLKGIDFLIHYNILN